VSIGDRWWRELVYNRGNSMAPRAKRPVSVWFAQIILAIYGAGAVVFVSWALYNALTGAIMRPEYFVFSTIGIIAVGAVFLGGVWGMAIRKPWGRWLGVAGLAFLLIAAAINQTQIVIANKGSGIFSVRLIIAVVVVGGLAFLAYMLAAGDAADDFFERASTKVRETLHADSGS
jgi:hypothetical protein